MAENAARNKLYEYRANSNLVLDADRSTRRREDATGEVETLNGRLDGKTMGSSVQRGRPAELDPLIAAGRQKRTRESEQAENDGAAERRVRSRPDVLTASHALETATYRPQTRESRAAYEGVLSLAQSMLGDVPQDVLRGAAEEVLMTLKDDGLRDPQRLSEIEGLFAQKIKQTTFAKLVALGKQIQDFNAADAGPGGESAEKDDKLDEEMGVAVVFDHDEDEDDDKNDGPMHEVMSDSSDDEGGGGGGADSKQISGGTDGEDGEAGAKDGVLSVHDVDAHWLQRSLAQLCGDDAATTAKLADDTLAVLSSEADARECENRLVLLLDYDKFDFIKTLLENRATVVYCTRLGQAQTDAERAAIEKEMLAADDGQGTAILAALKQTASAESWQAQRSAAVAAKARAEARALGSGSGPGVAASTAAGAAAAAGRAAAAGAYDDDGGMAAAAASAAATDASLGLGGTADGVIASGERMLDLDTLAFAEGAHLMSNKKCELPKESWRAQKKGYEEVHVPAVAHNVAPGEKLVQVSELPEWTHVAFKGIEALNRVQSKMKPSALESDHNLLLCAPTGAGKTNCAMMTMLRAISHHRDEDTGVINKDAFKIVYVAPMKALVQEVVGNFGRRLAPYGLTVKELSGDQSLSREEIVDTQVLVVTPEKWDVITRKAGDRTYTQLVRLVIFDEIHLLHDERGPVIEALVARTIRNSELTNEPVRLVGLSATLPNFEDVATFLRVPPEKGLFYFDNSFRPVPLQQQYVGITEKKALKRHQVMNDVTYEKTLQQAKRGNQTLIFVQSRAETAKTSRALRDMAVDKDESEHFVKDDSASSEILREEVEAAKHEALKDLLPHGFAIHHAGMARSDRNLVEDLFQAKHIQCLVSTSTLAWGVNLPAHTVIIKGTQMYNPQKGKWVELSPLDVMQMLGRAGRPQYDAEGEGIIITQHSELQYYLSLNNQQLPIESQMVQRLADLLNAEIANGSVQTVSEAARWLSYTYLYVRMLRNPEQYGVSVAEKAADPTLMQRRLDLCHTAAAVLDKHQLVKYERRGGGLASTPLGRVAAAFYVTHDTMATFNEYLKPSMSDIELFRLFSLSGEFKFIIVREEEKLELAKLAARAPIPVKEAVTEPSAKVNVLLQAYISRLRLDGFALAADMTFVRQSAARICRALFEISIRRGWAALATKTRTLCIMIERRMWASQCPLRQFGIPEVIARKLEKNTSLSWQRYYDLKPADLGELVRMPKMGATLHRLVRQFPKLELSANVQPVTRALLKVEVTITPDFVFDEKAHDLAQLFWVSVEDVDGEKILHHEQFMLKKSGATREHVLEFCVPILEPLQPQYFLRVASDRWLHSETVVPISFRELTLPAKFEPHTELLDLQPLPVRAFKDASYERLYAARGLTHFNPIQTQAFSALYETDDNALVCAPTGSDTIVCAEFALLRKLKQNPAAVMVCVVPRRELVDIRVAAWRKVFGDDGGLGREVVSLTGETAADLKRMSGASVVVTAPGAWDALTRRWRQRKAVQAVSLVIVEDLHLVGAEGGHTLEVIVSRTRYMASQLASAAGVKGNGSSVLRIVALSASIANARDVGEWIGATPQSRFSFDPKVRPIPVEHYLQAFDLSHFPSRMLAMAKPCYNAVVAHVCGSTGGGATADSRNALVFAPSRKQAQLTAIDLVTYAAAAGAPLRFAGAAPAEMDEAAAQLSEGAKALRQTCAAGVGFVYDGMPPADLRRVQGMFRVGLLRVLVAPSAMAWSVDHRATLVVLYGTESYDARERRHVAYPIANVLHMTGMSGRPGLDDASACVVLCHGPRREQLRRLLLAAIPVESHLDRFLHDHLNAEIVTKTIESKQDAVDYVTWTFLYRRLSQNPNYYSMQGATHRHISDHLSELIETVVTDLEESQCIACDDTADGSSLEALNLGIIASYYYLEYTTMELFSSSVTAATKLRGLLEIVANASEFATLPSRAAEGRALRQLGAHLPHPPPQDADYDEPHVKSSLLLQAHFSRQPLPAELRQDQRDVLSDTPKLLQALVDVISSNGWLGPALAAMELSQMVVQGMWDKDHTLLQIPHFTQDTVDRIAAWTKKSGEECDGVFDILGLEDDVRNDLLRLPPAKMAHVAEYCNRYPNIDVAYDVVGGGACAAGGPVVLNVVLERDVDEDEDEDELAKIGQAYAPLYPKDKAEGWWLVVGDTKTKNLLAIKRVALHKKSNLRLDFLAPDRVGAHELTLYFMCDAYIGCDQEYEFTLDVAEGEGGGASDSDDSDGSAAMGE